MIKFNKNSTLNNKFGKKKLMTNKKIHELVKKSLGKPTYLGQFFLFFLFYKRQTTCYSSLKIYIYI